MLKVFKYKLCPNRKQGLALQHTLDVCRDVFNLSLEQRKMHRTGQFAQMRELTQLRAAYPEYKQVHVQVPWTEDDFKVSEAMSSYWTNFIKNGNPNGPGLPGMADLQQPEWISADALVRRKHSGRC